MKYCFLSLLFLTLTGAAFSQINLVPNPSFEENDSCPSGQFMITPTCRYWYDPISIMDTLPGIFYTYKDWGTATYFHRCNNTTVSVPLNVSGVQDAKSGDAYAGMLLFVNTHTIDINRQSFNYISIELGDALQSGHTYYAEFYYSLAELYSNPDPDYFINLINALGIFSLV